MPQSFWSDFRHGRHTENVALANYQFWNLKRRNVTYQIIVNTFLWCVWIFGPAIFLPVFRISSETLRKMPRFSWSWRFCFFIWSQQWGHSNYLTEFWLVLKYSLYTSVSYFYIVLITLLLCSAVANIPGKEKNIAIFNTTILEKLFLFMCFIWL